jgi:hypothetical protein
MWMSNRFSINQIPATLNFVGNYIHEYDSKAKFKRLNFYLEFSKSHTNLLGTVTY